jgi:hypothetical protein
MATGPSECGQLPPMPMLRMKARSSDRSGDSRCSACQRRRQSATRHAFRDNGPVVVVMEILAERSATSRGMIRDRP